MRDKQNGFFKKQDSTICYLQETHLRSKNTNRLKANWWKDILCKWYPKWSKGSYTNIRQDAQVNNCFRTMTYIDKRINSSRWYNKQTYIHLTIMSDNMRQKKKNERNWRRNSPTIIVEDFNALPSIMSN